MHLTQVLLRFKPPLPKGHLWRGKYRLHKKVTSKDLADLKLKFEREEKNMFYLRHPYLTLEQSRGHTASLNRHENFIKKKSVEKILSHKPENYYLGDRFGFLKMTDSWEK